MLCFVSNLLEDISLHALSPVMSYDLICSSKFTSGATPANLLATSIAANLLSHLLSNRVRRPAVCSRPGIPSLTFTDSATETVSVCFQLNFYLSFLYR